jgi:hypothetical protein
LVLIINSFTRKEGKPIEYSQQMKQIMISEMLLSGLSYRSIGLSSADAQHAYAFPLDDNPMDPKDNPAGSQTLFYYL